MTSETLYYSVTDQNQKVSVSSVQCWDVPMKLDALMEMHIKEGNIVHRIDRQTYLEAKKS